MVLKMVSGILFVIFTIEVLKFFGLVKVTVEFK